MCLIDTSKQLDVLLFLGGPLFKFVQCLPAMHSRSPFYAVVCLFSSLAFDVCSF